MEDCHQDGAITHVLATENSHQGGALFRKSSICQKQEYGIRAYKTLCSRNIVEGLSWDELKLQHFEDGRYFPS